MTGWVALFLGRIFLAGTLLLGGVVEVFAGSVEDHDVPNIIIITLAGVRRLESVDDPYHQYMPMLWGKMRPQGLLYTDVVERNLEFHSPVLRAINTGVNYYATIPVKDPTVFQYARRQYGWPLSKTWAMGHWTRESLIFEDKYWHRDTFPGELRGYDYAMAGALRKILNKQETTFLTGWLVVRQKLGMKWINWASSGPVQFQMFKKVMKEYKPKLAHFVMSDVEVAHNDTYGSYIMALMESDRMIFDAWQMIQQDPFYKDRTYLFVSPDHDRNLRYDHHSYNSYDHPSHVWLYCFGPGIRKGVQIRRPIQHVDIFATVAKILRLKTHAHEGRVLKEVLPSL